MRIHVLALLLGAVASLVLLGCVGAETETETETDATDEAAGIGEAQALATGTDPVPHGRFTLVLALCKTSTAHSPCLVWPPRIQAGAR